MVVLRNDKLILMKEYGKMKKVGETYEVANITETSVVLRDNISKIAVGSVPIDDVYKYFKKDFEGWTDWVVLKRPMNEVIAYYRTNGKKVQVKTVEGIRSEATCCKSDDFNLATGVSIAFYRCYLKEIDKKRQMLLKEVECLNKECDAIVSRIKALGK